MSSVADITQETVALKDKSQQHQGAVYYRARSLLLLANSIEIDEHDKTHLRPSIRLMLSHRAPFQIRLSTGQSFETQAIILSPRVENYILQAKQADIAIFDFLPACAEYVALQALVRQELAIPLSISAYAPLLPILTRGQEGLLTKQDIVHLMGQVIQATTGQWPAPLQYDERINAAIRTMENLPLTDISVKRLADVACLSPDRFRHLFKETTGCTVSSYARSTAVWRATLLLDKGMTITEISHAIGFHDVSHLYHAFAKEHGVSLSDKLNPRKFKRIRCNT